MDEISLSPSNSCVSLCATTACLGHGEFKHVSVSIIFRACREVNVAVETEGYVQVFPLSELTTEVRTIKSVIDDL